MFSANKLAWKRAMLIATCAIGSFVNTALASDFQLTSGWRKKKTCVECQTAPSTVEQPVPSSAPPAVPQTEPPTPPVPDQPTRDLNELLDEAAASDSGFASAPQSRVPAMIGDFFGITPSVNGTTRVSLSGNYQAIFLNAVDTDPSGMGPSTRYEHAVGGAMVVIDQQTGNQIQVTHNYPDASRPLSQTGPRLPGPITDFTPISTAPGDFQTVQNALTQLFPGSTLIQLDYNVLRAAVQSPANGQSGFANLAYDGNGTFIADIPILIILPSGGRPGAQIGLLKVSENNSVLPRDRFIFNYNYFNNVPLSPGGIGVNRFAPGFEKTFLEGMTSVQVVLPFASTLDSTQSIGSSSMDVELGNLQTITKVLFYGSDRFYVGGGLGIESPTANDLSVGIPGGGGTLLQVKNQAVRLQPYVGAIYSPNNRAFVQSFIQVDVDVSGNSVHGNPDFSGMQDFGTLYGQPLFLFDTQFGYWFYQAEDPNAWISAANGVFEVHYNQSLASTSSEIGIQGLTAKNLFSDFSIVNLTVGSTIQIGRRTQVLLGTVFPVGSDRSFDYEFAGYVNYFFGRDLRRNVIGPY